MLPCSSQANGDDFQAGHDCAGGIGAVGGGWDEANVAMGFAADCVIGDE